MWKNRLIYLLFVIASGVFVSFYGGRVPYTLFYFSLFLPVFLLIYLFYQIFVFRYYQVIGKKNLVKGETTSYELHIKNETLFSFPGIRVKYFKQKSNLVGVDEKQSFCILPGEEEVIKTVLLPQIRGEYLAGTQYFIFTDPFGIIAIRFGVMSKLHITALPRITDCAYPQLILPSEDDKRQLNTAFEAEEVDVCVRKYATGDSLKLVHWKSSAKKGELLVHKMVDQTKREISVLFDLTKAEDCWVEDMMLEHLIAVVNDCRKERIPCRTFLDHKNFMNYDVHDQNDFETLYEATALIDFTSQKDIYELLEIAKATTDRSAYLIVLTHTMNSEFVKLLANTVSGQRQLAVIYFTSQEELKEKDKDLLLFLRNTGITVLTFSPSHAEVIKEVE